MTLGAMGAAGAAGGLSGALSPETLFGVSYLDGDPDKIREAADRLDMIADAIDKHFQQAHESAQKVWQTSTDEAAAAFRRFWNDDYGKAVLMTSVKVRQAANACRAYAEVIETINYFIACYCAYSTMVMMWTIAYQPITWKLYQAIMRKQANLLISLSNKWVILLLPALATLAYWVTDSLLYPVGEVAIPLAFNTVAGIKTDMSGADVRSLDYNATAYRENFVANVAFNGVADGTAAVMRNIPGLKSLAAPITLPNGAELNTGSFIPRMAGSTAYSMTLDVQHGDNPLPGSETGLTEDQMYQKFIVHGTRSLIPRIR
ncbi:hypothetical protein [Microbispora sp. CSR-4]|nr:hypothetical protein [Microbispora sp. CSR-4]